MTTPTFSGNDMFIPVADVQDLEALKCHFGQEWKYVDETEFEGFASAGSPAGTASVTGRYHVFTKRMQKLTMFMGANMSEDNGTLIESDGSFLGQLSERPKTELLKYLAACEAGNLTCMVDGKSYKVTEFGSTGEFRAKPGS